MIIFTLVKTASWETMSGNSVIDAFSWWKTSVEEGMLHCSGSDDDNNEIDVEDMENPIWVQNYATLLDPNMPALEIKLKFVFIYSDIQTT